MIPIRALVAPAAECISMSQARLHLRIDATGAPASHPNDPEIAMMLAAAREAAEQFCSRAFVETSYQAEGRNFELPLLYPVKNIIAVKYMDSSGFLTVLDPTVYRMGYTNGYPALVLQPYRLWPATLAEDNAVQITFNAGVPPDEVPQMVKAAILLILAGLDENRSDQIPMGSRWLLAPHCLRLGV